MSDLVILQIPQYTICPTTHQPATSSVQGTLPVQWHMDTCGCSSTIIGRPVSHKCDGCVGCKGKGLKARWFIKQAEGQDCPWLQWRLLLMLPSKAAAVATVAAGVAQQQASTCLLRPAG